MSGSNKEKEENLGFATNNVCLRFFYFNFCLAISKEHLFLFFCMKYFCMSLRRY